MKNKRNPKKRRRRLKKSSGIQSITVSEYDITYDRLENKDLDKLPQSVRDQIPKLHDRLLARPEEAIPDLEALLKKYPDVPLFYNYLASAYNRIGDFNKASLTIVSNYKKHPNYLFAKAHYAELCIQRGDLKKVSAIFDNKFDLKLLYPERDVFHVSEVTAFMGVTGLYFYETGDRISAETCYKVLRKIASGSPYTKNLKKKLRPSITRRIAKKLFGVTI
ncbi:hypothetical protein QUF72_18840 [Desulfobacterales bacterium HSG2]|nr:hypothetical protein [Desulfobacterales bacterium HSG2]